MRLDDQRVVLVDRQGSEVERQERTVVQRVGIRVVAGEVPGLLHRYRVRTTVGDDKQTRLRAGGDDLLSQGETS